MPDIPYTIKRHKKARRVIISVHPSGEVVVTLPTKAPIEQAESFVQSRMPWIITTQEKLKKKFEGKIVLKQSRKEYIELKNQALTFISERINFYNLHYKFKFRRISIRMQKSRWGSCSRQGNLNFNYKLLHLPSEIAHYIVVHELCHLQEMNHGPKFWALVAETIPNHKELRKFLRNNYIHVS
jgi:predicted metal-dependent hydrolase